MSGLSSVRRANGPGSAHPCAPLALMGNSLLLARDADGYRTKRANANLI